MKRTEKASEALVAAVNIRDLRRITFTRVSRKDKQFPNLLKMPKSYCLDSHPRFLRGSLDSTGGRDPRAVSVQGFQAQKIQQIFQWRRNLGD